MANLEPHSPAWYDRLAQLQEGFYSPWKSRLGHPNGEEAYLELVQQHLSPQKEVLDVACGHGEVALAIAPLCGRVLAYDRIPSYIELARTQAAQKGVKNVEFVCADSSATANQGLATIPAEPNSFDLLISRRGPLHWIEDARRVGRSGATLIQLNPMKTKPPAWNEELPEALRIPAPGPYPIQNSVERRLGLVGLEIHSCWSFEVPEIFEDSYQLYLYLTWGQDPAEVPPYQEVQKILEHIFEKYAKSEGLALRFRRFLWKAVLD